MKADLDLLKDFVALRFMDLSTLFDELDDILKVDVFVAPNDKLNINVPGDGGEETQKVRTLKTDEDTMGVEPIQEDHEDLA